MRLFFMGRHAAARRPRIAARGFATITTTIILGIALAFVVILLDAVLGGRRAGKTYQETLSAEQIAEAGVQKAIFCLNSTDNSKCGGTAGVNYPGETGIAFGGGSFTTVVGAGAATKTVTSTGVRPDGTQQVVITDVTSIPPTNS